MLFVAIPKEVFQVAKGLEGVVAADTQISLVDGQNGVLVFRGYYAQALAQERSFEEVAHLLWKGILPSAEEEAALASALREGRTLPLHVAKIIDVLPASLDMMSVIRTAVSSAGVQQNWPPTPEQALRFTALIPTIVAYRHARLRGAEPTPPNPQLSHAANYLYMVNDGKESPPDHVRALEAYLIITMEHGMNASTFTGRVITSTQSDMASALAGAVGAMKGPLHGGAPSEVMQMIEDIGSADNVEPWLRREIEAGNKLMGFGHRVYKTRDPRAVALRGVVQQMPQRDKWFDLSVLVEDTAVQLLAEYKPGRNLYANVEFWAAAILRTVGLPKELWTPTFTASRTVGWTAHILEQAADNRLIRPQSVYVGPMPANEDEQSHAV
jgi:citrate synthase